MLCSFNPPSNGRFRPPLSKKAFPVHRVEKRYASREVGFFCFPKFICSLFDGGVFQFFGNTVICLMCPINRFSDHRWRKESGRNLYLSKNYLGKKFCEKQTKKKSSRLYRKESSSWAVHRKQFFYLRVAAVSNQLFRATG